jgi:branched-subunit amino acid aminotransferase/4-amino-4-deoxychorismate lyase
MHPTIFFNDRTFSASEDLVQPASSAALYGKGIFTTISIRGSLPFLWEKHWRRLADNARRTNIDLANFDEERTRNALDLLIAKNSVADGRARITFFDTSASSIWQFESEARTSLLITTADAGQMRKALRLGISSYGLNSASPLAGIKSCNYLENILALDEAKRRGFDEAVRVNERGEVASAWMANIFWIRESKLFTPALSTGCLAGTTREFVLENIDCEETVAGSDELKEADGIFLTSAGLGIASVSEIEGRALNVTEHEIGRLPEFAP